MAVPLRPRIPVATPADDPPPKSGPANDNPSGVLGHWENGAFKFASPAAEEQWVRRSYNSGVNAETWARGKELDARSVGVALAGFGGPMPGLYQGPDGKYRTMNRETIEAPAARDHRNQHLAGKSMDQLATATSMPGEDAWVEKWKAAQVANDNAVGVAKTAPAAAQRAVTAAPPVEPPKLQAPSDTGAGRTIGGRFAAMQGAQKSADVQGAKDITRIGANAILGNYGDELRAAAAAAGSVLEGKSFGESYDSNLLKEKAESAAAQERQGITGTGVELLTSFIPIVGDLSGAAADFKDWQEHGDEWGWGDYGLVALGLIPEMPNRKAVKGAEKIGEELLETVGRSGDEIADLGKAGAQSLVGKEVASIDHHALLEEAKQKVLTSKEARNLGTENRGLIYVQGNLQGHERAKAHQSGGEGAFSDIGSRKFAEPALRFDNSNPRGVNYIKFDSAYVAEGNSYTMLVDSKTKLAIWSDKTKRKTLGTFERVKQAIDQNSGYKVMYEFDSEAAAEAASDFIHDNNFSMYISVGVRKP